MMMNPTTLETTGEPTMTKNIVIGIGGTGLSAIRELRRLMAERYSEGIQAPEVAATRFLAIDTDSDFASSKRWTVLGKDISLKESERVIITGDQLGPLVANPADHPDISPWLPAISSYVGDPGPGAKGIRPYGRLIYEYGPNKQRIRDAVTQAFTSLNNAFPAIADLRVYMVSSLSGGTGSGMMLPFAEDLERWHIFRRGMAAQKFRAFLVLPPLQITGRHDRYHANAYAALRELNYASIEGRLPFSNTYLLESVNAEGHTIGLDNLPLLIAQRMLLNIQGGVAAQTIDGLMDNPNLGDVDRQDTRRNHSRAFSTFGLSSVSFPREVVARSVALSWSAMVVENWLAETQLPSNVSKILDEDRTALRLSSLHVHGDADPFGPGASQPHALELRNKVDEKINPLEKRNLAKNGHKIRKELEEGFREAGVEPYYAQRNRDVSRAADIALERTRLQVSRQISDPARGLQFAKQYLTELRNALALELTDASSKGGPNAERQLGVFQTNYSDTVNMIAQHEEQMIYFDSAFARDKANMSDDLKSYLVKKADYWSAKYASSFLELMIPRVETLLSYLDVWFKKTSEVRDKLRARGKTALEGATQEARENGSMIFNARILARVAAQAPPPVIVRNVEEGIRYLVDQKTGRPSEALDLFQLVEFPDADAMVEDSAFHYILSPETPIDIQRSSLYDWFTQEYPEPGRRREKLTEARNLSHAFIRFSPEQQSLRPLALNNQFRASIPDVLGRITIDNNEARDVVRRDVIDIGVPEGNILLAPDPERIIFLNEVQAFPLRLIESAKFLKESYDKFQAKEPLHIDKRDVPKLYELYLLSQKDRDATELVEETYLLARTHNWLKEERNPRTGKQEIRYEYEVPGQIGAQVATLGADWEQGFHRLVEDALAPTVVDAKVTQARTLLTERLKGIRSKCKTNPDERVAQREAVAKFLAATLETYPDRIDNPQYQRDQEIANRIVQKNEP
jgi:Tubulin like